MYEQNVNEYHDGGGVDYFRILIGRILLIYEDNAVISVNLYDDSFIQLVKERNMTDKVSISYDGKRISTIRPNNEYEVLDAETGDIKHGMLQMNSAHLAEDDKIFYLENGEFSFELQGVRTFIFRVPEETLVRSYFLSNDLIALSCYSLSCDPDYVLIINSNGTIMYRKNNCHIADINHNKILLKVDSGFLLLDIGTFDESFNECNSEGVDVAIIVPVNIE